MPPQAQRYKLTLCFEGTKYCGWQKQPGQVTVQSTLEKVLSAHFDVPVHLRGCSRTDSGVHAAHFVAHFDVPSPTFVNSDVIDILNMQLPSDIRAVRIELAEPGFHACFSAKKKCYTYTFQNTPISPFKRHLVTHVKKELCIPSLKKAIPFFLGEHDFSAFANEASKGAAKNSPVKTIYSIDLTLEADTYTLRFVGNGFLYKMVRNMVGTLFAVGHKKMTPENVGYLLKGKDRTAVPAPALPGGLCLQRVYY